MNCNTVPLTLSLSFHHKSHNSLSRLPLSLTKPHTTTKPPRTLCCSASSSSFDREEQRWIREEQRWMREEQRWVREEQRWMRERESLLREIAELRMRIQTLEEHGSNVAGVLEALKEKKLVSDTASSAVGFGLEEVGVGDEEEERKEVVVEERSLDVDSVSSAAEEENLAVDSAANAADKKRRALRVGSEGEEVLEMQEALLKLGFYCGEEDMEFSSFSTGTERAVKTWQSTFGGREDGIMTEELLERLYMEEQLVSAGSDSNADQKGSTPPATEKGTNGAAIPSVTALSDIQKKVIKEDGVTEFEASEHRVFLLGENRWEEPSRLAGRGKQTGESKASGQKTQCLTCRGEGRLMCTECDGTGEPNVEPQFLEWVDEEAKCPYCEGLGYIICDVCYGQKLI